MTQRHEQGVTQGDFTLQARKKAGPERPGQMLQVQEEMKMGCAPRRGAKDVRFIGSFEMLNMGEPVA